MNKYVIASSLTAICGVSMLSGLSVAHAQRGSERGAHGNRGLMQELAIPVANASGIADCLFDRMDHDGDGLIDARDQRQNAETRERTLDELNARTAQRFAARDQNGDGVLNQADRDIQRAQHAACAALFGIELPQLAQQSDDGEQERQARRGAGHKGARGILGQGRQGRQGSQALGRFLISSDDMTALAGQDLAGLTSVISANLVSLDANGDGTVTADELPGRNNRKGSGRRGNR